jgi:hypothetical protein
MGHMYRYSFRLELPILWHPRILSFPAGALCRTHDENSGWILNGCCSSDNLSETLGYTECQNWNSTDPRKFSYTAALSWNCCRCHRIHQIWTLCTFPWMDHSATWGAGPDSGPSRLEDCTRSLLHTEQKQGHIDCFQCVNKRLSLLLDNHCWLIRLHVSSLLTVFLSDSLSCWQCRYIFRIRLSGLLPLRINLDLWILQTVGNTPWTDDQPCRKAATYIWQHKHRRNEDTYPCL